MNRNLLAYIAAILAMIIYGLNFSIAKEVMPDYIKPYGFIFLRLLGAGILFWIINLFIKTQKIDKSDYLRIGLGAILGTCLNMILFFKGLNLTTPISAAIILLTAPINLLLLSFFFLKEKLSWNKIIGIFIGFLGAGILIFGIKSSGNATDNIFLGNVLVYINVLSYCSYTIIMKKLLVKYHPFLIIKWMYLIGFIVSLPVTFSEFMEISWHQIPNSIYFNIIYVVVGTTFLTYLFSLFALRTLTPTNLGVLVYIQPIIASFYAILVGQDTFKVMSLVSMLIIFVGVYLSSLNRSPKILFRNLIR